MTSGAQKSAATTWNSEPTWNGWVESTLDALLILEAARRGLIPRVTRRLVDSERKMISSGSVFVFDEEQSGIKRWTDGLFWSPSRILGNFLLYRETDKRGPGHKGTRPQESAEDPDVSQSPESHSLSRPKTENNNDLGLDKLRERSLMGSLTNSYKFKADGLMKKTFSLTIGGVAQHLISYYRIEDVENGRLRSPSSLPELASLDISPDYLDKTHFRNPPKVEVGPDGVPRYRGEADDVETSTTSVITAPLSSGLPLLTDGRDSGIRRPNKRLEPFSAPQPAPKRQRKRRSPEQDRRSASQTPSPTYPDSAASSSSASAGQISPVYPGFYSVGYGQPQGMYSYPPVAPMQAQGSSSSASYTVAPYGSSSTHPSSVPQGAHSYYGYPPPHAQYAYPQAWPSYHGYTHSQPHHPPPQRQQQQPLATLEDKDGADETVGSFIFGGHTCAVLFVSFLFFFLLGVLLFLLPRLPSFAVYVSACIVPLA
ncbi:hypothetical protein BT96DRAFT_890264 [Gymnopus androsaceus JB14]|uniref:Uncharacterized protein n=1 Tax=Gymnopus androsaceus JB14 TaxID=1447944 RepID=A0A6A4GTA3_9AGAR|nr:hypothetical protein BT96DRAFT_890264 [Gymnopus androsaceus JB14]